MTQLELQFSGHVPRSRAGTLRLARLGTGMLRYRFVRARRRSIGISVYRGEVEVRAPRHVPVAEVEAFISEKERWIARRLAEASPKPQPLRWSEGEMLPLFGRPTRLTALPGAGAVHLSGDRLMLPSGDIARWRELTLEWLRATALCVFHERASYFATLLGVRMPSVGLSDAQTQWGSCSRNRGDAGRVLLNWRLAHLPPHLTDYVVAH